MRKYVVPVVIVALTVLVASLAWALQVERTAVAPASDSGQMGSMSGQMCGMTDAAAISVSNDEVYVVKGDTLYKFSRDLKLVKQVALGSGADQGSPRAASGGAASSPSPSFSVPSTSGHRH